MPRNGYSGAIHLTPSRLSLGTCLSRRQGELLHRLVGELAIPDPWSWTMPPSPYLAGGRPHFWVHELPWPRLLVDETAATLSVRGARMCPSVTIRTLAGFLISAGCQLPKQVAHRQQHLCARIRVHVPAAFRAAQLSVSGPFLQPNPKQNRHAKTEARRGNERCRCI